MNKRRVSALALACLASLGSLGSTALQAQGLRSPGGASQGLGAPRAPAAALPLGSAPAAARQADYIVAVVNSEPITNNEVRARMARVEGQMRQQGAPVPESAELARQVLDNLITERALVQQARDTGIKVDDALVDQAEANVARQNGVTVSELRRRVEASGMSQARFRADLRNQLLLTRLRERDVENRVRVSDLDVDQFIREQEASTEQAGMELNLGHVLVLVPEGASAEVVAQRQARAQDVADRARKGEDFGALARAFSDAQEANSGGLLGLRAADRYPSLFIESTQALPVGGIAGPVRSPAGFHVLKVVERERAGVPGTQVVQTHARHILLRPSPQLSEAAAVARLADYKKRIESGNADFAALARENSQDGSAKDGGDLGWTNPGQFVPEFEQAMNNLDPGQISPPIVTRFGVHLIRVDERTERTLSSDEQRQLARNMLREKKAQEAFDTWAREIRGRAYVEYRDPPK